MPLLRLARPGHWVKNAFVLMPVVFAIKMSEPMAWLRAGAAAAAFCFAASAIYIVNDLHDRRRDRCHPRKKDRPLAAGAVSPTAALVEAGVFVVLAAGLPAAVWAALALPSLPILLAVLIAYLALQLAYTYVLKDRLILDVLCIAMGFVLRALAGAVAIAVEVSPWLFVCTFTVCLFMGFCKRFNENATLGDPEEASNHRPTLVGYSPQLLTHLLTLSASVAAVAFLLYTLSPRTVAHFGTHYLVYTLPIFFYGIFRFAMLSMAGRYADPTDLVLHDRPLQATVALWFAAVIAIIRWGPDLARWVEGLRGG